MKKAEFQLEELTCPSCVKKIESALADKTGISSAKVFFNASKVKATFDDSVIDTNKIGSLISNLGYEILKTKVN